MECGVEHGRGWSLVKQLRCNHISVGGQTYSDKSDQDHSGREF